MIADKYIVFLIFVCYINYINELRSGFMKKCLIKCTVSAALCGIIAFSGLITAFSAENKSNPHILAQIKSSDGFQYVEVNKDFQNNKVSVPNNIIGNSNLPARYNLAENGYVTDVRNQNPYPTCWSFATLASLESNILKSGNSDTSLDLSEKHLAWFNYNGADKSDDKSLYAGGDTYTSMGISPYNLGGSMYMSAATLMRRYGAVDESVAPYDFSGGEDIDSYLKNTADIYLKDVEFLSPTTVFTYGTDGSLTNQALLDSKTVETSLNQIKQNIYSYGAVAVSYYCSDSMGGSTENDHYWNDKYKSYYFNAQLNGEDNFCLPNHGITLVGWDDNFSKDKFEITPPDDGAWIVKNSWGSEWGDDGYFYLSYYDVSFSDPVIFKAEDAEYKSDGTTVHEYENIYQYDGVGFGDAQIYFEDDSCKAANFFTSRDDEVLEAISVALLYQNVTVNYEVYTSVKSDVDPTDGELAAKGSKYFANKGYFTIPLESSVDLSKGEKYSVVLNIVYNYGAEKYSILACETSAGSNNIITASENQSSYFDGTDWNKIDESSEVLGFKIGNAVVKAFTNDAEKYIEGDVNSDGIVNIADSTYIQKYCVKLIDFNQTQMKAADVNKDGLINVTDATIIQKRLVGVE